MAKIRLDLLLVQRGLVESRERGQRLIMAGEVLVNDQLVDEWIANNRLPGRKPGSDSSSRRRIKSLALRSGDEIRIEGVPDSQEYAGLDFVSITPIRDPAPAAKKK
jgi:hypothetical protein